MNIPAPPDSPMALGRVIDNKLNPLRCLNIHDSINILAESVYKDRKTEWCHEAELQSSGKRSVWGRFIYGIYGLWVGGDTETRFDSSMLSNYVFSILETTFFEPDDDYIAKTMRAPSLENFLDASRYKKPVYLITGLKIARGVRATSKTVSGAERHTTANTGPLMGLEGSRPFGGDIGKSSRQSVADCFAGSTDIVIGYRLRKIICGQSIIFEHEEETNGTVLDVDDDVPDGLPAYEVKTAETRDAVPDETDSVEIFPATDDIDRRECQCFVVVA